MTTTTPESRGRIAYTAFLIGKFGKPVPADQPTFDQLPAEEQKGWITSANTIWDLAKTGHASL